MAKVVLFGNNEVAAMNAFYLRHDSPHDVVAFAVDGAYLKEPRFEGRPVVPFEELPRSHPPDAHLLSAPLGFREMNRFRAERFRRGKEMGYDFLTYISSKTTTWPDLEIGENCFLYECSMLQYRVKLGDNVVIGVGVHIGHHSVIGDHSFIADHSVVISAVNVGEYCFLGANSTIRDGIDLGDASLIGAGAYVRKNVGAKEIWVPQDGLRLPKSTDDLSWSG